MLRRFLPSATAYVTPEVPSTDPPVECTSEQFSPTGPYNGNTLTCLLPAVPASWIGQGLGVLVNNSLRSPPLAGPTNSLRYKLYYAKPTNSSSSSSSSSSSTPTPPPPPYRSSSAPPSQHSSSAAVVPPRSSTGDAAPRSSSSPDDGWALILFALVTFIAVAGFVFVSAAVLWLVKRCKRRDRASVESQLQMRAQEGQQRAAASSAAIGGGHGEAVLSGMRLSLLGHDHEQPLTPRVAA